MTTVRVHGWVNVYEQEPRSDFKDGPRCHVLFDSKVDADLLAQEKERASGLKRIACVEVNVVKEV